MIGWLAATKKLRIKREKVGNERRARSGSESEKEDMYVGWMDGLFSNFGV